MRTSCNEAGYDTHSNGKARARVPKLLPQLLGALLRIADLPFQVAHQLGVAFNRLAELWAVV